MSRIKAALICLTAANFVLSATTFADNAEEVSPSSVFSKRSADTIQSYVVGAGDYLYVEVSGLPELSGSHSIGPDGVIYLPLIRDLYVEGLSIPQLKVFFTEQYSKFVINPVIYVSPIAFRSVRVFLDGEVGKAGYYTLSVPDSKTVSPQLMTTGIPTGQSQTSQITSQSLNTGSSSFSSPGRWPTLFDGLKAAGGFTLYSDISKVTVIRRQPLGSKASKKKATIDFSRCCFRM